MKILNYEDYKKQLSITKDYLIEESVYSILKKVKEQGDRAIRKFTKKFDEIDLQELRVKEKNIKQAVEQLDANLSKAIDSSAQRARTFAQFQLKQVGDLKIEIEAGVVCGQIVSPIERVGVYVPGGRYPLVSSVIMGVVPAQVAGVSEICVCSPPGRDGSISKAILGCAGMLGISEIYCIGGAQAIAGMAYGTETMKKVDKIVGPGNKYVNQAKKALYGIVGIDFIAGPTEVLIIADDSGDPVLIAADLLAQAEHDIEAKPVLVSTSKELWDRVKAELRKQLGNIDTAKTANIALEKNGVCIIVKNIEEAVRVANEQAPEHLELQVKDPDRIVGELRHYGSLFIGQYAAEVLGDYSSGLNHTLPTNRAARYTGGLSVFDFIRLQTTLRVDKKGFKKIASDAEVLARGEGLTAHANAIGLRHKK
ncbi:histidinol dehydrogenase [candidate division WOR-3 bacterium RBG_13_43_14]|uniref:Histidinol dehydrogenase n=1 Tax=candidate division WOR-3 bacterium RBG_13_43_14 TaxID=1802590 RepID=A0A1F4U422_UNCW3|nr:MAG: histidinol dehydrogenase [candidate division WOR-3 bacterium RBG_13_43_14]